MEKVFKTLVSNKDVELVPYIKEYLRIHPNTQVLIGCDSQNRKRETIYAIVIGLYVPGKGAHVLYSRFSEPRVRMEQNPVRLLNEVWYSVEIAELIKNEISITAAWIDIDINADIKYKSNIALANALGLVKGMGYTVRYKNSGHGHQAPLMCYAADHLVK
jgi:predicted RNase H-related nuclease YkuK (DUF458 family)